jgi:hypothetical protein
MRRKNKIYLVTILLLFTALVVVRHFVPRPVDWRLSFNGNRKSPYACSVAKDLLPVLFPGKEITVNTTSFYMTLHRDTLVNKNLIIIDDKFDPDDLDLYALLDFAAHGNSVFISSLSFSDKLCDTLKFRTNMPVIDTSMFKPVKEALRLSGSEQTSDSVFCFRKRMPESRFVSFDTLRSIVLGSDGSGKVNFILTRFGKGKIFLHCQPLAFTNFHLLYGNYRYACTALSDLPVVNTIWDQYYKPDKILDMSPVRYILSQPALKSAWLLLLITIFIYMIFGSRRMERAIPVIRPEQNASLDFVTTVGKLYYRSQNHTDLARKKLMYFHEFIRNRYFLERVDQTDEQIRTLSLRSGVEEEKVRHLVHTAGILTDKDHVSREELIGLHKSIEDFYKNCK